jgi:uncharacterized membrane protein
MADKPVFLYMGQYDDPALAKADLETVRKLHRDRVIGTYDAAVVVKKPDGKVHIDKWEKPTQHGAWTGAAVGAVVGIIFPPAIIGSAVVGGVAGGLIGHFWRGMSRKDMHELGELLDGGQALLVVVGHDKLTPALEKAELKAQKQIEKQIDLEAKDLEKELAKEEKELS